MPLTEDWTGYDPETWKTHQDTTLTKQKTDYQQSIGRDWGGNSPNFDSPIYTGQWGYDSETPGRTTNPGYRYAESGGVELDPDATAWGLGNMPEVKRSWLNEQGIIPITEDGQLVYRKPLFNIGNVDALKAVYSGSYGPGKFRKTPWGDVAWETDSGSADLISPETLYGAFDTRYSGPSLWQGLGGGDAPGFQMLLKALGGAFVGDIFGPGVDFGGDTVLNLSDTGQVLPGAPDLSNIFSTGTIGTNTMFDNPFSDLSEFGGAGPDIGSWTDGGFQNFSADSFGNFSSNVFDDWNTQNWNWNADNTSQGMPYNPSMPFEGANQFDLNMNDSGSQYGGNQFSSEGLNRALDRSGFDNYFSRGASASPSWTDLAQKYGPKVAGMAYNQWQNYQAEKKSEELANRAMQEGYAPNDPRRQPFINQATRNVTNPQEFLEGPRGQALMAQINARKYAEQGKFGRGGTTDAKADVMTVAALSEALNAEQASLLPFTGLNQDPSRAAQIGYLASRDALAFGLRSAQGWSTLLGEIGADRGARNKITDAAIDLGGRIVTFFS